MYSYRKILNDSECTVTFHFEKQDGKTVRYLCVVADGFWIPAPLAGLEIYLEEEEPQFPSVLVMPMSLIADINPHAASAIVMHWLEEHGFVAV
jgi:hypothetical protein